jgi:hypothetical protein
LVSEWLNSLTQGIKPVSLYLANTRHWSTIIALMPPNVQPLPQELLAMILTVQSHPSVATNLENFSWRSGSLPDTLAVLHLTEKRCSPEYNTGKAAQLDQGQGDSEPTLERPARTEQDTTVVKVMHTLGAQTNSAVIEFLKGLQHLDQAQHAETEWFSTVDECPLPFPTQVVTSVKMILVELKRIRWGGTLQDVHEKAGVIHETFKTHMCNREYTMCDSAAHFFHSCSPNRIRPHSPRPYVQAESHPTNTCTPQNNGTLTRLRIARQDRIGAGGAGGVGSRHRSVLRTKGRVINTFEQQEIKSSGASSGTIPVVRVRRGGRNTSTIRSN